MYIVKTNIDGKIRNSKDITKHEHGKIKSFKKLVNFIF